MNKCVLLVDDQTVFCEPIAAALRAQGCEVHRAEHGAQALQRLQTIQPDLIMLDLIMPVMDGLTFLAKLRDDPRHVYTPVMVLTAANDPHHRAEAERFGVREYLLKSRFSLAEMRQSVQRLFDAKNQTTAASEHASQPLSQSKPLMSRQALLQEIDQFVRVKALSSTTERVLELTASVDSEVDDLVAAINLDAALALRLLKLANSVTYRRHEPVQTVRQAVIRLGMGTIRQMVLTIDVFTHLSVNALSRWLDQHLLWEHSLAAGLIADQIALRIGLTHDRAELAFTAGLLHDVGQLMLAERIPKAYAEVLEQSQTLGLPLDQVETHRLGIDHAGVAEAALTQWRLPSSLVQPIAHHHDHLDHILRLDEPHRTNTMIVALADRMAHAWLIGASGNGMIMPLQPLTNPLGLTAADIRRIKHEVHPLISDLKTQLFEFDSADHGPNELANRLDQLKGHIHPLLISDHGDQDAFGLLIDTLVSHCDAEANFPPNLAIVHQPFTADRAALARHLLSAESKASLGPLPTLLISPRPDDSLDASAAEHRTVHQLLSPVHINALIQAMRHTLASCSSSEGRASTG
ncbi:HDOD domain-containing protein [Planctomycetales bacterium ZRK34]|nr:HDOD domain-containing protein [Planctomycetales bacterium ZRK34]